MAMAQSALRSELRAEKESGGMGTPNFDSLQRSFVGALSEVEVNVVGYKGQVKYIVRGPDDFTGSTPDRSCRSSAIEDQTRSQVCAGREEEGKSGKHLILLGHPRVKRNSG